MIVAPPVPGVETVTGYDCDAVPAAESVAWATNVNDPALDGVPVMPPDELRLSPVGSWPEATAQVTGGVPPEAANVALYATPAVALGMLVVVIDSVAAMTKESAFDAICPALSIACTVTLYVPALDGVPEIMPVACTKTKTRRQ